MLKRERVSRRRYQTHAEARADISDYIECLYNPRKRRKPEALKRKKTNLTQPSVVTGLNPNAVTSYHHGGGVTVDRSTSPPAFGPQTKYGGCGEGDVEMVPASFTVTVMFCNVPAALHVQNISAAVS